MNFSRRLAAVPWLVWLLGIGVMWFWHIPAVFDSGFPSAGMMHSGGNGNLLPALLHDTEYFTLIIIGILFCWPVIGPFASWRLQPLKGVIYLVAGCISGSLLGALITFSPVGMYKHYLSVTDASGLSSLVRNNWHITTATDQQIAGLIMWVPGCLIYLTGSLYLIRKWFMEKEDNSVEKEIDPTFNTKNI
jgi:cytochrome c oxidase assembly factor CtaG